MQKKNEYIKNDAWHSLVNNQNISVFARKDLPRSSQGPASQKQG